MMCLSLSPAALPERPSTPDVQVPSGTLALDPEYAEYLRWQATALVADRARNGLARDPAAAQSSLAGSRRLN